MLRKIVSAALLCIAVCVIAVAQQSSEEGFKPLFDGKSLNGWEGGTDSYKVEDGAIVSVPKGGGGKHLYTTKEFSDFDLKFEFKLTPGANNGIGIRVPLMGDPAFAGMEIQVLDDGDMRYKNIQEWQHHGSVYGVVPAKTGALKPTGEWNQEEIIARGKHITVILNGQTIVDADVEKASANGTLDKKDHPGLKRDSGHICFCGHGTEVFFRNLRIKELK
jgi:hypothetical protein